MFDHPYLHRDDFKLLADFLANGVFATTADASQFILGQFVDDFDARQSGRQWLALATALGGGYDIFFRVFIDSFDDAFCFVEQGQLRRRRICLLGLSSEQTLAQQRVFFFQMNNAPLVRFALKQHLLEQLLEQRRVVRKIFGHRNHALDYTESGHESRRQNLMWSVTPEIKTVEHPVEFLDGQDNRFVHHVGRRFETFGLQALEPKAEAVALPVQNLHPVAWLVEEDEKHRVEHRDFDVQLDQGRQTVNGLSEVDGLGVEIHFFNFCVGAHHGWRAPERNREHSIRDHAATLNMGFMERLRLTGSPSRWGIPTGI